MEKEEDRQKNFSEFSKPERKIMHAILRADNSVKQNVSKLQELAEKIEKLKRKYVNAFRMRN